MGDTLLGEKGSVMMESVEEVKRKCKGKENRFGNRYGFELKLRCVKLRLEERLPVSRQMPQMSLRDTSGTRAPR
jgi:hypothetical protein